MGARYTIIKEPDLSNKEHDHTTVTVKFETNSLPIVLESIEDFLRACGFVVPFEGLKIEEEGEGGN